METPSKQSHQAQAQKVISTAGNFPQQEGSCSFEWIAEKRLKLNDSVKSDIISDFKTMSHKEQMAKKMALKLVLQLQQTDTHKLLPAQADMLVA